VLTRLRPGIHYTGVDPSAYAVKRHGARRNLILGSFGGLDALPLASAYDLIVCSNALYYVPEPELAPGLRAISARLGGVAFLEAYSNEEGLTGDTSMMEPRDEAFYRRLFRRAGFVSCGSHCYVGDALAGCVTSLERGGIGPRT
jgi:hypothetical protein